MPPGLEVILILNTTSDSLCEYYPKSVDKYNITEYKEIASMFKPLNTKGTIITKTKKMFYYPYIDLTNSIANEDDNLYFFLVTTLDYPELRAEKFFEELFAQIDSKSYVNYKINEDFKHFIVRLYIKYQGEKRVPSGSSGFDVQDEEYYSKSLGSIRETFSYEFKDESNVLVHGLSGTELLGLSQPQIPKGEIDNEFISLNEREKILKWKKEKFLLMTIFAAIIMLGFISLPISTLLISPVDNTKQVQ